MPLKYKPLINKALKQDYKTVYHVTLTLFEAGKLKSKDPISPDTFLFVQLHYTALSFGSYSDQIAKTSLPRSSTFGVLRLT